MCAAVAVEPTNETYTFAELDQIVGSSLYVGRVHNAIATFLDTTHYQDDVELFELLNLLPAEMVLELLPATTVLLSEVKARIDMLNRAIDAALDSTVEQINEGTEQQFAQIIEVEFGKDRKKNGG